MNFQKLFLTFFGTGLSPIAPGTIGSLAAIPFGLLIMFTLGANSLVSLVLVLSIIAILEINRYEKNGGVHDDKSIVIDEVVGIWLTMAITFAGAIKIFPHPYTLYFALILSFASFRLFDIWKPSTIGYIDKKVPGGLGVVGDDLLAGFAAGVFNLVIFKVATYLLN